MNYRDVILFLDYRPSGNKKIITPAIKELPNVPSFFNFLKEDFLYHIIAGTVFGVGHYYGIRFASKIFELAKNK